MHHSLVNMSQSGQVMRRMLSSRLRNLINIVFYYSLSMNIAAEVANLLIMYLVWTLVEKVVLLKFVYLK